MGPSLFWTLVKNIQRRVNPFYLLGCLVKPFDLFWRFVNHLLSGVYQFYLFKRLVNPFCWKSMIVLMIIEKSNVVKDIF